MKRIATAKIEEVEEMLEIPAYGAASAKAPLAPFFIERRRPGPHDLLVEILYCGVCHSDIHQARGEWSASVFPMVPGHEIVGTVVEAGHKVEKWKVGAGPAWVVSSIPAANAQPAWPAKNSSASKA